MYSLSKDYEKLYELVCQKNVVAGFVDYSECRDICEIKQTKNGCINLWVRGLTYAWIDSTDTKEYFIGICQKLNLEWIVPHHKN